MPVIQAIGAAIGHFIGKVIGLSGVAAITAVVPYLTNYLNEPTSTGLWVVAAVAGLVVWQKGIVPVITSILEALQPKETTTNKVNNTTMVKEFLSFGNW